MECVIGEKYFVSSEYEKEWVKNAINVKNEVRVGVCRRDTGELIGLASIIAVEWLNRSARTQVLIGEKSLWGQGYGGQALYELLKFAFDERGFERIWVRILDSNTGSLALHRKIGFKDEGIMRRAVFKNGKFNNVHILSILRDEFEQVRRSRG